MIDSNRDLDVDFLITNVFVFETLYEINYKDELYRILTEEISEILRDNLNAVLIEKNMFLHLMNKFFIRWDFCNFKTKSKDIPELTNWKHLFLKSDVSIIFFVNNLFNSSIFNQLNSKYSLLNDLIPDLKEQLTHLKSESIQYKHKYKLLLNLLKHNVNPINLSSNDNELNELDLSIFTDLHKASNECILDMMLVNDTTLMLCDNLKSDNFSIKFKTQFPNISSFPFTLLFLKTENEEYSLNVSGNNLSFVQNFNDEFEYQLHSGLLSQTDIILNNEKIYNFELKVINKQIFFIVDDEQRMQSKFTYADKIKIFIGDSKTIHKNKAIFIYEFLIYVDKEKPFYAIDFTDFVNNYKSFDYLTTNCSGIFISFDNSIMKEAYFAINFFKKFVSLLQHSTKDIFFINILPLVLKFKQIFLEYNSFENISNKQKNYCDMIFYIASEKIKEFNDIDAVLQLLFEEIHKNEFLLVDSNYYKSLVQFLLRWEFLTLKQHEFCIDQLKYFFDKGNTQNRNHNLSWIEHHIDIFDCIMDYFDYTLSKNLSCKINIYNFFVVIIKFSVEASNLNIVNHLLQYCIYKISFKQIVDLKLTDIIIKAAIDQFCFLDSNEYQFLLVPSIELSYLIVNSCIKNSDIIPSFIFEKCLLLFLTLNKVELRGYQIFIKKGLHKMYGCAIQLKHDKNMQYLESFCKVLLVATFDIEKSSFGVFNSGILQKFDPKIYQRIANNQRIDLHLLLIKILCISSIELESFLIKYIEFCELLSHNEVFLTQAFTKRCEILMALISLGIQSSEKSSLTVKKIIANILISSAFRVKPKIFDNIFNVLSKDDHVNANNNITKSTKSWLALNVVPLILKNIVTLNFETIVNDYLENIEKILIFFGDIMLRFKLTQHTYIDLLQCTIFLFEAGKKTDKINSLLLKVLNNICVNSNVDNDNIMSIIIENQQIFINFEIFFPCFMQMLSFSITNYQLTTHLKEEKCAFINIMLNSCLINGNNGGFYSVVGLVTKDYSIKKLIESLSSFTGDDLIHEISNNQKAFKLYLEKTEHNLKYLELSLVSIIKLKLISQDAEINLTKENYRFEEINMHKSQKHIVNIETKNRQIRKLDFQDTVEVTEQIIDGCKNDVRVLKFCMVNKETLQNIGTTKSLYRGYNKMMQRKILISQGYENNCVAKHKFLDTPDEYCSLNENQETFCLPDLNQNWKILKRISLHETIRNIWNACIVTGIQIEHGVLILTDNNVIFYKKYYYRSETSSIIKRNEMTIEEEASLIALNFDNDNLVSDMKMSGMIEKENIIKITRKDITFCLKRVFVFKDIACEFLTKYNESFFFTFVNKSERDRYYNEIHKSLYFFKGNGIDETNMFSHVFKSINLQGGDIINKNGIGAFSISSKLSSVFQSFLNENVTLENLSKDWQEGKISNFFYLLGINFYAGRSFNDITQYPIFPWVISDYESDIIDLKNKESFRDLTKPMGAQDPIRLNSFVERYAAVEELNDELTPPFHYGTHYSSAMIVASYLIRVEPFTSSFKKLQGGNFGPPDRIFNSIERAWKSASKELTTDVRELIPEFYFLPEFLENGNEVDFGVLQSGEMIQNVNLPNWSQNKSAVFIQRNIEALESEYVSKNLNHWIDLIFGYKQRGEQAKKSTNIFNQLTYSGAVKVEDMIDIKEIDLITNIIHNFGQTPLQLFLEPHLQRAKSTCNKNIITINKIFNSISKNSEEELNCKYCKNLVTIQSKLEINSDCTIDGNSFGIIRKHMVKDKQCSTFFGYAHITKIIKLIYSDNFDILLSLDADGVCLKWIFSTMKLIGKMVDRNCKDIIMSNYSSNVIFKKENKYVLSTFNGMILNDDIFKELSNPKVFNFVDVSISVKKKFAYLIDYVVVLIEDYICLYEVILSDVGDYILEKKLTKIHFKSKKAINIDALIMLDDSDNNHLHITLKIEVIENNKKIWFLI
ncbi:hypothetical protein QEN19_002865 [Hanseniaspora menglaensis]